MRSGFFYIHLFELILNLVVNNIVERIQKDMKKLLVIGLVLINLGVMAQETTYKKANVDYDAFENLVKEVKAHRAKRLISVDDFVKYSQDKNVVILDTRSDSMYQAKHIKGAIHLNFSDFTQENLKKLIPDPDTKVLIYCNNNFDKMDDFFPTKMVITEIVEKDIPVITLALNIPTYINLYGYGYRNVYELHELVSPFDKRIQYEGTAVSSL